jgi:hypothetical protein
MLVPVQPWITELHYVAALSMGVNRWIEESLYERGQSPERLQLQLDRNTRRAQDRCHFIGPAAQFGFAFPAALEVGA